MTPLEVVKMYNEICWNGGEPDKAAEILAETVIRNYPGERKVLTRAESVERIRDGQKRLQGLAFNFHRFIEAGDMVTMIWDAAGYDEEDGGQELVMAGIEVFRVEDGEICEVWNPEYAFGKRWP